MKNLATILRKPRSTNVEIWSGGITYQSYLVLSNPFHPNRPSLPFLPKFLPKVVVLPTELKLTHKEQKWVRLKKKQQQLRRSLQNPLSFLRKQSSSKISTESIVAQVVCHRTWVINPLRANGPELRTSKANFSSSSLATKIWFSPSDSVTFSKFLRSVIAKEVFFCQSWG